MLGRKLCRTEQKLVERNQEGICRSWAALWWLFLRLRKFPARGGGSHQSLGEVTEGWHCGDGSGVLGRSEISPLLPHLIFTTKPIPFYLQQSLFTRSIWVAKLTHPLMSLCVVRVALPHKAPEGSHQFWKLWQNPCPHSSVGSLGKGKAFSSLKQHLTPCFLPRVT